MNGQITLSLSCNPQQQERLCGCSIKTGQQIASQADKACPLNCQTYNSASGSCIGPAMNTCGYSASIWMRRRRRSGWESECRDGTMIVAG